MPPTASLSTDHSDAPLASIALATFNGARFLRRQLDSLISQNHDRLEIVVSDDGSSDATAEILQEYAARDARIKWVRNPKPDGYIRNFEHAISLCRGEVIFLSDQDDIWHPEKIAAHLVEYRDPRVSWVYNRVVLIDDTDRTIGYLEDASPTYYAKKTLLQNAWGSCILGCATSYRAKDLHRVLPASPHARAHDSWIQFALFPRKSVYIDTVLQDYRLHGSNTAGWNKTRTPEQDEQSIASYLSFLKSVPGDTKLALWKRLFILGFYLAKRVRDKTRPMDL